MVKPRWLFLQVHTDAGLVGLGEPIVEGRAETCAAAAVKELEDYLIGKDPRAVVHLWKAIYRCGPILTSVLSGVDQDLWDIKGKALGAPVYELLGGPTRSRVRGYAHARDPDTLRRRMAEGFRSFKTGVFKEPPARTVETPGFVQKVAERFAAA